LPQAYRETTELDALELLIRMKTRLVPHKFVLWAVDLQRDFMEPDGKLYVAGAEKLLPNIRRLIATARDGEAFLVAHGCFHTADDPEFEQFPAHCVQGTAGAEFIDELSRSAARVRNHHEDALPGDLVERGHVLLEKQTLDIFQTLHVDTLLSHIRSDAEFVVFGVVTEYCVRLAARGLLDRGRKVWLVSDAIETLDPDEGKRTMDQLEALGAKITSTEEVLGLIHREAVTAPFAQKSYTE
jgi:nicotinamidase/pyrazinamidase